MEVLAGTGVATDVPSQPWVAQRWVCDSDELVYVTSSQAYEALCGKAGTGHHPAVGKTATSIGGRCACLHIREHIIQRCQQIESLEIEIRCWIMHADTCPFEDGHL